jgi:large subunit ribosomal protein L6
MKVISMKSLTILRFKETLKVPQNIQLSLETSNLIIKGPLGEISMNLAHHDTKGLYFIRIDKDEDNVQTLVIITQAPKAKFFLRAFSSLIKGYFQGLSRGFLLHLEIIGVGLRVHHHNNYLEFRVGFSHSIKCTIPQDIKIFTPKSTQLCLFGIDKHRLSQVAAYIRHLKPPEPYKGKGIRFKNETVKKKEGKKK